MRQRRLSETRSEINRMERELDVTDLAWPPGSYPARRPKTRFDIIPWQHFDTNNVYLPSDFINVQPLAGADLIDARRIINRSVEWLMERYNGQIRFKQLLNGYKRFDPSRGLDYILDLSFRDNTGREIIKRVEVSKPLGRVEMLQMAYVTENTRVYLILPLLAGDKQAASSFMSKYSETCAQSDLTFLMLVLLYEPNAPGKGHAADVYKEIKELAVDLSSKKHKDCKITWISIRVPSINGVTSLEDHLIYFATMDLLSKKLGPDSLVLLTEPYIELRSDYLNRIRMGTIVGKQVYSPIPFTEFHPEFVYMNNTQSSPTLEIHKNTGRFDSGNIRHLSFYIEDYISARAKYFYLPMVKADKDIIKLYTTYNNYLSTNASSDPVNSILDMFSRQEISVLRASEPALRLHRIINCTIFNENLPRTNSYTKYNRCIDPPIATRSQLGQTLLNMIYKESTVI